jgi:hypothetical protein
MESKVSEKDMREVYFQAFGKQYDSADRKQAPLPLNIAYLVALNKLKREGKYEGGGEITDDTYYQSVNDFVFFCMNYPANFLFAFGSLKNHLANKFKTYYNSYGSFGVMIKFYTELDSKNRRILTDFAYKNYDGTYINSDISEVEYFNSVNHFIFFCFNFPNNFMEAFPSNLRVHLSEKWSDAYNKKGSVGAMIYFWSELSDDNRKRLANWSKENYTGTRLYEAGGLLGEVAGMLPSPLPMSTIQPMAKGGMLENAQTSFSIHNDYYGNLELGFYNIEFKNEKGTSISNKSFYKLDDAFETLFEYLKSENGQYIIKKEPKSNFYIEERSYDGKSTDSDGYPDTKYKTIFKISSKKINELTKSNNFEKGGQLELFADGGNVLEPSIYYFNDGENDITFNNFEEAYNEAEKLGYNKFRDNLGGEYFVNKDLTKSDFKGTLSVDALPYLLKEIRNKYEFTIDDNWLNGTYINGSLDTLKYIKKFLQEKYNIKSELRTDGFPMLIIINDIIDFKNGGGVDDCIEYIKNSESIKDNGYYLDIHNMYNYVGSNSLNIPKINSLCLITFNSGGQKNLKAVDTINSMLLSSEIAKLLNIDIEIARIIVSEQITFSKPFTMNMLDDIENKNIIIADRDTIVCTNLSMQSDDSEYKSAFNSKRDFLKGKTELERIEDLKKEVSKNKWSREALTEESGIVKVYSRMYDLDKETVASIFNQYQKKYADGGDMDDISLAKSNAIDTIDFEYYAKEYAGDSWDKMSDSEKAELIRDIRDNWFNDYEYADGGETEFPIYTYGKIDGKPFEVIGVNYKTGIVRVKNFSEYGIKEMTISEWIPLTYELGTPASFIENGREVSGEVVMRDGKRAISLYKDDNYGGDSERIRFFNQIDLTTLKSFMDRETFSLGGFLLGAGAGADGGETEFPIYTYGKIDGKPFEVIGVNYKTGIVRVKNFSEYGIKEMTISEWIPLTFELGTPASFVENGREVSGEVVMRDGKIAISLYKDDNYVGDSERIRFFNQIDLTTLKSFMDRETFSLGGFLLGAGAGALGYKLYLESKTKKGKEKFKRTYNKVKKKVGL